MRFTEVASVIRKHKRFAIAGHTGPDGDSIGACFGLALALAKLGKEPFVVLERFPEKFNIIPGRQFIWDKKVKELDVEVFIAVDCADADRLGPAKPLFERTPVTVCIDHHETNVGFAQFNLIDFDASSTCEMVYDLITPLVEADWDMASAIYAGMVTDTGGFRYRATAGSTMENVARLMETGMPFTDIYSELMNKHSFVSAKALGLVIANMKQALDGRIVYSCVTREELATVGAKPGDLDRTAEYLMNTRRAEIAFFVYEKESAPEVKISLRSLDFHVGRFAAAWGGGGHRLAAGSTVRIPVAEIVPQLLEALEAELLAQEDSE
ncbi:MAG: bifunctional oligoribonuclease/PAP phosphatase NrnA [Defluviitaleaceae bacterium]|nr:bifunctional oligoribonuclease/PAP phosphatase NrnA [Defluviitaleaceae bacterium]MCL2275954.1 bifunctional oligoribonuclease/PAP phosphatase NrnA [Defluviitaleaceae bacterium]